MINISIDILTKWHELDMCGCCWNKCMVVWCAWVRSFWKQIDCKSREVALCHWENRSGRMMYNTRCVYLIFCFLLILIGLSSVCCVCTWNLENGLHEVLEIYWLFALIYFRKRAIGNLLIIKGIWPWWEVLYSAFHLCFGSMSFMLYSPDHQSNLDIAFSLLHYENFLVWFFCVDYFCP